jgi:FG-GAP repeat
LTLDGFHIIVTMRFPRAGAIMNPTHFAVRVTRRPLAWGSTLLLIVATSAAAAPFAREARLTGHGDPLGTWGARFGGAVAMDGDTLAVGAPAENLAAGDEAGVVYVYLRTGDQWALQQRLLAADGHGGVTFGASLALDGDTLLVGAPHADATGGLDAGAAYVFVRSAGVRSWRRPPAPVATASLPRSRWRATRPSWERPAKTPP